MKNKAQGKVQCFIIIKAARQVLYSTYSMSKAAALTILKNFITQ